MGDEEDGQTSVKKFLNKFDAQYPEPQYKVTREEIGGLESTLDKIDNFAISFKHGELYDIMGVPKPKGIILHGPAGTGKTHLIKYMAGELNARFVSLNLEMFESKWVGQSEEQLKKILDNCKTYHAITNQRVVLCMDELDDIYKSRSLPGWHQPRVNMLNREMDGMKEEDSIVFAGTTNHLEAVDPAALRPGRFDYQIQVEEYKDKEMSGVSKAIATSMNKRSMYDPFRISDAGHKIIGSLAFENCLTPAELKDVYVKTAENKIRLQIANIEIGLEEDEYIVRDRDVLDVLKHYNRPNKNNKRRIGFVGYEK